jgi:hypothetical protein
MASLFWVGGTATYDGTTARFATTSGGVATVAATTSSDDVFFDPASGAAVVTVGVTMNVRQIDFTGFTGTFNLNVASTGLFVSGVVGGGVCKLVSTMTWTQGNGASLNFTGTGTTINFTSASRLLGNIAVGGTCTVVCQDAWSSVSPSQNVSVATGTLNTNGFAMAWGSFTSATTSVRTLTFGSSQITCAGVWTTNVTTGLTITANTATVTFTGNVNQSTFGGTWNGMSVVMNGITAGTAVFGVLGTTIGLGSFTFTGQANKTIALQIRSNLTCSGTFTVTGNTVVNRPLIQTDAVGTTRTITAAVAALTNADFMDITFAGAATWSGTSVGDCAGNTGLTPTASATQTWQGTAGGSWSDVTKWTSRVPLPQDDVVIASAFAASQTIAADMPRLGRSIDLTGVSGLPTLNASSIAVAVFGGITLGAGLGTWTSSALVLTLSGRGAYTITSNGEFIGNGVTLNAPGGTYTLADDVGLGSPVGARRTLTITAGTFNANGHNVSINGLNASGIITRSLLMGSGTWTLTGTGSVWNMTSTAALTFDGGTSTIVLSDASATDKTFTGGGLAYGTLRYTSAGAGAVVILGSNTFVGLDIECSTARTIPLPAGATQTVDLLTFAGGAGQLLSFVSSTPGTPTTITRTAAGSSSINTFTSFSSDIVLNVTDNVTAAAATAAATAPVVQLRVRPPAAATTASATGPRVLIATVGPDLVADIGEPQAGWDAGQATSGWTTGGVQR